MSDVAGVLLGLAGEDDDQAARQRKRCLRLIEQARGPNGGWGPFANYRAEAFDTAIVLVALAGEKQDASTREWITSGRRHLLATQLDDGTWPPTTRPAGAESYADRVSTTAWAVLGLMESENLMSASGER